MSLTKLGCTSRVEMNTQELLESLPVPERPYQTNARKRETLHEIVRDLKDQRIVSETHSPCAFLVLLGQRKNTE